MSGKGEELLENLHRVVAELEALAHGAGEAAGEGADMARERMRDALGRARKRVAEAEEQLGAKVARGARTADEYVHENPWLSIGIAALVAYLAGTLVGSRRGH